jgi:hypothetical protein
MKRLLVIVAMMTLLVVGFAVTALADSPGNSEPGLDRYHPQGSDCGQYHGAFGFFGKDNSLAGGADGQATGDANSFKGCQRNR